MPMWNHANGARVWRNADIHGGLPAADTTHMCYMVGYLQLIHMVSYLILQDRNLVMLRLILHPGQRVLFKGSANADKKPE